MKNAILGAALIAVSYWIANVAPTEGPIAVWSFVASFCTGICGGFVVFMAWVEWN